ncbi:hypothetical protein [Ruegeria arenilitoris]|nr:hypothetical protein [Ruegeria arenilitoris]
MTRIVKDEWGNHHLLSWGVVEITAEARQAMMDRATSEAERQRDWDARDVVFCAYCNQEVCAPKPKDWWPQAHDGQSNPRKIAHSQLADLSREAVKSAQQLYASQKGYSLHNRIEALLYLSSWAVDVAFELANYGADPETSEADRERKYIIESLVFQLGQESVGEVREWDIHLMSSFSKGSIVDFEAPAIAKQEIETRRRRPWHKEHSSED